MTPGRLNKVVWALVLILVIAAAAGLYRSPKSGAGVAGSTTAQAPRYHCPMHPTMVSDRLGDCPICGMRLVAFDEDDCQEGASCQLASATAADPPQHGAHTTEQGAGSGGHGQHTAAPAGKKKVIYRSTMNPNEVSDLPGKDSMGMDMVPEELEEAPSQAAVVGGRAPLRLSEQKRQMIGVRTTPVEKGPFVRTIRTVGRVTYDETRLRNVFTKVSGWVDRLYANTTGQLVKEGEPLLTIYSPELVSSAQEYLLALRGRDRLAGSDLSREGGERLLASTRRRLLLFGITPQQIAALKESGQAPTTMTLHAPISGNIITRNVTQGDRIEPGTKLLDIAELSHVWVLADVYEYELPFVHVGQKATMTLSYLPGRTFEGRITFVYPTLTEATRTVKVRLEFPNPDLTLRPEMFAQVEIHADMGERLSVPESAVISTGTRDIAFVERGDGYFEPRELKLGLRLPDRFEVLDGLAPGEPVLVSGNFLLDSESKLKAALTAAGNEKTGTASGHSH